MPKIEEYAEKLGYMQNLYFKAGSRTRFRVAHKEKFTPFISKDIQYIVYTMFDKMFNVNLLKSQGILEKVVLLHNFKERQGIEM